MYFGGRGEGEGEGGGGEVADNLLQYLKTKAWIKICAYLHSLLLPNPLSTELLNFIQVLYMYVAVNR